MELASQELRERIVRPTLHYLGKHSQASENLLVAIARWQQHHPQGRTEGIYPIDAALHQKVWNQHLAFHPDLASRIRGLASQREFLNNPHTELVTNLAYATAIAWAVYLAFPQVKHNDSCGSKPVAGNVTGSQPVVSASSVSV
ncbi:MAG: hypothetical protein LRY66_03485 [Saccharospirillaceae bacterium]|nr:hypothetical protein [Saccharospirillaceae bacterium]MCD8530425.1 hypothetical protein [Saccharospirillaceae bacterium]